jgi:hypothetical protein
VQELIDLHIPSKPSPTSFCVCAVPRLDLPPAAFSPPSFPCPYLPSPHLPSPLPPSVPRCASASLIPHPFHSPKPMRNTATGAPSVPNTCSPVPTRLVCPVTAFKFPSGMWWTDSGTAWAGSTRRWRTWTHCWSRGVVRVWPFPCFPAPRRNFKILPRLVDSLMLLPIPLLAEMDSRIQRLWNHTLDHPPDRVHQTCPPVGVPRTRYWLLLRASGRGRRLRRAGRAQSVGMGSFDLRDWPDRGGKGTYGGKRSSSQHNPAPVPHIPLFLFLILCINTNQPNPLPQTLPLMFQTSSSIPHPYLPKRRKNQLSKRKLNSPSSNSTKTTSSTFLHPLPRPSQSTTWAPPACAHCKVSTPAAD